MKWLMILFDERVGSIFKQSCRLYTKFRTDSNNEANGDRDADAKIFYIHFFNFLPNDNVCLFIKHKLHC